MITIIFGAPGNCTADAHEKVCALRYLNKVERMGGVDAAIPV